MMKSWLPVVGLCSTLSAVSHAQPSPSGGPYIYTVDGTCDYVGNDVLTPEGDVVTIWNAQPRALTSSSTTLDYHFQTQVQTAGAGATISAGYPVNLAAWKYGYGAEDDPPSIDTPYGRLLSAFALLSLEPAPGYTGFVAFADDFVKQTSYAIEPACQKDGPNGYTHPFPARVELHVAGLNSLVFRRAGTLVHEASHSQGNLLTDVHTHNGPDSQCPKGTFTPGACCRGTSSSCDMRFDDWRPSSYHATYLASLARSEFLKGSARVFQHAVNDELQSIVEAANDILIGRFAIDPGFRYVSTQMTPDFGLIGPQGNEYLATQSNLPTHPPGPTATDPTPMDPIATHFCFLTEVEGQFQRSAQFISIQPDTAGDRWELATGQRSDLTSPYSTLDWNQLIRASARCLPLNGATLRTYQVSLPVGETEATVVLESFGSSSETACFLTGIGGAMQDSTHGARVVDTGTSWVAHLLSGHTSAETRLSAEFGCIDAKVIGDGTRNVPGTSDLACSSWHTVDLAISPPDVGYCALSGVSGQFEGHQEFAEIVPHGEISSTDVTKWGLSVGENRAFHTVFGYATCFLPPGQPLTSLESTIVKTCATLLQNAQEHPEAGGTECCAGQ